MVRSWKPRIFPPYVAFMVTRFIVLDLMFSPPGSGDQRYFRIQIFWTRHNEAQYTDIIVLVPEQEAPESLVELWQKGEGCVCD